MTNLIGLDHLWWAYKELAVNINILPINSNEKFSFAKLITFPYI
jgi:hypothetical protein